MSYVSAIVLAAGKGSRIRAKIPKPLIEINAKPIIIRSLDILSRHPNIKEIIPVVRRKDLEAISRKIKGCSVRKIKAIVVGGKERQDSVINGLRTLSPKTDLVLIHDGVRPFIDKEMVSSVIQEAKKYGAAILGVPVKATIKETRNQKPETRNKFVERTLNRKKLWEVQTPQVFKKDLILKAYEKFGDTAVTDDASLVEKLGVKVRIVMGSYFNIKITTPEDLVMAEAICRKELV